MKKRAKRLCEVLRAALAGCGESTRAVGRATGVPYPCLSRFLRREQDLKLSSAEALIEYFGVGVAAPAPKPTPPPKPPNPRLAAALAHAGKPRKGGRRT